MGEFRSKFLEVYSLLKSELLHDSAFEFTHDSRQWVDRVPYIFLISLSPTSLPFRFSRDFSCFEVRLSCSNHFRNVMWFLFLHFCMLGFVCLIDLYVDVVVEWLKLMNYLMI